jgi:hypothetical protein
VATATATVNPDRLAELEDERRFLLRSLRDLDAEHAVGDVDDADYATLRDGYTKRAADVLREIDAGRDELPSRREHAWRRRTVVAVLVVAVAVLAGVLVARTSGQRTPSSDAASGPSDDLAAVLADARQLLGVDLAAAQQRYQQVLDQRPDHPEALTYNAWLLYIGSRGAEAQLAETAAATSRQQLQRVTELDPTYPDPHCFLAVIASNEGDDATAQQEATACVDRDPPSLVRQLVEPLLGDVTSTTSD